VFRDILGEEEIFFEVVGQGYKYEVGEVSGGFW
jgi:hypothetical protein